MEGAPTLGRRPLFAYCVAGSAEPSGDSPSTILQSILGEVHADRHLHHGTLHLGNVRWRKGRGDCVAEETLQLGDHALGWGKALPVTRYPQGQLVQCSASVRALFPERSHKACIACVRCIVGAAAYPHSCIETVERDHGQWAEGTVRSVRSTSD